MFSIAITCDCEVIMANKKRYKGLSVLTLTIVTAETYHSGVKSWLNGMHVHSCKAKKFHENTKESFLKAYRQATSKLESVGKGHEREIIDRNMGYLQKRIVTYRKALETPHAINRHKFEEMHHMENAIAPKMVAIRNAAMKINEEDRRKITKFALFLDIAGSRYKNEVKNAMLNQRFDEENGEFAMMEV